MLLYWINKQRLIGASEPLLNDVAYLKNIELGGMICLQENSTEEIALLLDIPFLHKPIPDFSVPSDSDLESILDFFMEIRDNNPDLPVMIHCTAGHGRTGTILAALLILSDHFPPQQAISEVRKINPLAIETKEQENFLLNL